MRIGHQTVWCEPHSIFLSWCVEVALFLTSAQDVVTAAVTAVVGKINKPVIKSSEQMRTFGNEFEAERRGR